MANIVTKNADGTTTYSATPSSGDGMTPQQIAAARASGNDPYAITPKSMQPATPVAISNPVQPVVPTGTVASGNALLAANTHTLTQAELDAQNAALGRTQQNPGSTSTAPDYFKEYLDKLTKPSSASDLYTADTSGIDALQADKNAKAQLTLNAQAKLRAVQAQIQAITDQGTADSLLQENTFGTTGNTSGQQAQIARNAAIRALPLQSEALVAQAELASAQGNEALSQSILQQAQDHADKMFQIHITDTTNDYNYRKDLITKVYDFATKQQQVQLDAQNKAHDEAFKLKTLAMTDANDYAKTAIANGQGALGAKIQSLDTNSITYSADVAKLAGQIVPKASTTSDWTLFNKADGTTVQYNQKTGEIKPLDATGAASTQSVSKSKDQIDLVLSSLDKADKLAKYSGQSSLVKNGIGFFTGPGNYGDLEALTNTLRTNVLTMATDPTIKKFFGPQMSNADVQLMTAAGTTLNPELQSPQAMRDEITRLKDFTYRAKLSLGGATQFGVTKSGVRVGMMPDGSIQDANGNKYDANGNKI